MFKDSREALYRKFNTALVKACTKKEEPCKEKHVRRTLVLTFGDDSRLVFFTMFGEIIKIDDPIMRFKCFFILHLVLREGAYHKNLVKFVDKMLKRMGRLNFTNVLYADLCELYLLLLNTKVAFLKQMIFLKPNYTLFDKERGVPFKAQEAGVKFLHDLSEQFTQHAHFVTEVLKNTRYKGFNPSILPGNQCQLRAAIPVLKDMEAIYKLMVLTVDRVVEVASQSLANPAIQDYFVPSFKKYNDLLEELSPITYISQFYTLPTLPNTYPFLLSLKQSNRVSPQISLISISQEPETSYVGPSAITTDHQRPPTPPSPTDESLELLSLTNLTMRCSDDESNSIINNRIKELEIKIQELETLLATYQSKPQKDFGDMENKIAQLHKLNQNLRKRLDAQKSKADERDTYKHKLDTLLKLYTELRQKYKNISKKYAEVENSSASVNPSEQVATLKKALEDKDTALNALKSECEESKRSFSIKLSENKSAFGTNILKTYAAEHSDVFEKFLEESFDVQTVSKASMTNLLQTAIQNLNYVSFKVGENPSKMESRLLFLANSQHYVTQVLSLGKQYMEKSYDISFDDALKKLSSALLDTLKELNNNPDEFNAEKLLSGLISTFEELLSHTTELPDVAEISLRTLEEFDFDKEAESTLIVIKNAREKVSELSQSVSLQNATPIESHSEILRSSHVLFELLSNLIQDSKVLEVEIASTHEVTNPEDKKVFYKKNSAWARGLVGFATSLSPAVNYLADTVAGFVKGEVLVEELTVALNSLVCLISQFVVVSRQKADPMSHALTSVRKDVRAIREVANKSVQEAKISASIVEPDETLDLTQFSRTKLLALENDINIRILTLEKELVKARVQLGEIRSSTYKHD